MFQKIFTQNVLPMVLFPALSVLAFRFTLGHMITSGLGLTLKQQCSVTGSAYRLVYTGIPVVDQRLCGLVSLFHLALTPEALPFVATFMVSAVPLLALPAFESVRNGRPALLALPVVFGLVAQLMTVAVIWPMYWLIFILTGAAQRRPGTHISKAHAQAVVFGITSGAAVPTLCLTVLEDPYVTAVWQFFPVLQWLAQSAHLLVRHPSANAKSGYSWIRALYIGAFMLSAATHIAALSKAQNLENIKALFLPSLVPLTSAAPNLQVRNFLQWDAVFAFGSTLLASVWFAQNAQQAVTIVLWNITGTILVGPGAAIAAVALWRESYLHSTVHSTHGEKLKTN
ncbi:hypothetical protein C8J57DRAFT_264216 [Mycena rebaudengoi]|nr:hypothetical protein C8J57DRAFT_264216 [Mycena rebaudengoi]